MILGLGSDITDARRIAKVIERHGERFLSRVFTDIERAKAERRKNRAETYAKRFAAKEACAKALGTGIRRGVWWRDMGVVNMPSGRPTMALTGGARKRLDALTPKGHLAQIDLTITDEGPMAVAFVVISAVPRIARAAAKSRTRIRPETGAKGRTKSRTKSGAAGRTKRRAGPLR
jgi:holo-[acyl-carrier protein] synthase